MILGQLEGAEPLLLIPGEVANAVARILRADRWRVSLRMTGPRSFRTEVEYPRWRKWLPFERSRVMRRIEAAIAAMAAFGQELEVVVR